jgi:excisionase family DNA binding protein
MGKIISSKQAAELLGTSERRVQQLAEELGVERFGRQFLLTEKDLKKMQARKTQRGPQKGERK